MRKLMAGSLLTLVALSSLAVLAPGLCELPGLDGIALAGVLPSLIAAPAPAAGAEGGGGTPTPVMTALPIIVSSPQSLTQNTTAPLFLETLAEPPAANPPAPLASLAQPAPAAEPPAASALPSPAPAAPQPAPARSPNGIAGYMNYIVQPGDDWTSIAAKFATTGEAVAKASGFDAGQVIYPGMLLRVPTTDKSKVDAYPKARAIAWSEVSKMWAVGTVAQVMDVETGSVFFVMRRGGWAHADVEPVSARDTKTILGNYGGNWNWARRSIVVTISGQRIAASQNFYPHGQQSIVNNNMPGHFCIHFLGSTTHGSSYTSSGVPTLDPAHQRCVQAAVGH